MNTPDRASLERQRADAIEKRALAHRHGDEAGARYWRETLRTIERAIKLYPDYIDVAGAEPDPPPARYSWADQDRSERADKQTGE